MICNFYKTIIVLYINKNNLQYIVHMITKYIIFDIYNSEFFIGGDSDGRPFFHKEAKPLEFDSEEEALKRLTDEIELFGTYFLCNRKIEIKKVYIF
jgi:hypothetical protein